MSRSLNPFWLAIVALALPSAAFAQAQTGTGGGPTSTVTAPNTSSVGRTMPPAAGAGPREERTERTPQMKDDDRIQKGICIGCGAK
ncbi:hypothetical protein [Methylobacterium symbioticum]|uniref:Uncharacterized protein n=1 Tax=Methylobacterium symbioticum TaxID=2584084 RepID=A0A509EKQ3_9HYPH|nr:hypothetical protein [Methylobacterium symbioticum]VUD74927.1 hypothetical protein MET9862_05561 [Methylobacterium symbioticum]